MDDEALLQRLGVTAARAEDIEREVIAAHIQTAVDEGGIKKRDTISKHLSVLNQEIEAVQDGLERLAQDGIAETEQELENRDPQGGTLHSALAKDRLRSLKTKRKRLRAELRALENPAQQPASVLQEDNDFDAALDAASGLLIETERERLIRTGALTPFHKVQGYERRIQRQSDVQREKLVKTSVFNAVTSIAAISRSRPSTKLLDAAELPKLEGPTCEFRRLRKGNGRASKKRKRPLPDLKWRRRQEEDSNQIDDDDVGREVSDDDSNELVLEGGLRIPMDIYDKLFDYQKTGVKWLWELHSLKTGGIIGDEMGLGKTIQVIAFLAALHNSRMYKPSIVVCPVTLVFQWKREVEKWYPKLEVQIVHDCAASRLKKGSVKESNDSDESADESDGGGKQNSKLARWDHLIQKSVRSGSGLIVTTYEQLRLLRENLLDVDWGYAILDEGHKIRNPDCETTLICKQLQTVHRIIMTGAPIQNKLTELWSLFDFVFPGKLGVLPVFQSQFAVPIQIGGYANATSLQVSTAYKCAVMLRDLIMPYILRRMKSDVEAKLTKKTEHVIFCNLTEAQRAAYRSFIASSEVESIFEGSKNLLYGIDILRKICNHPDLLERECSDGHPDYGSPERSGKLMVVGHFMEAWKEQGHKVLMFCQTQQMLDILESFVVSREYTYRRMDGSTSVKQRDALMAEFNESSEVFVFLLTTKVGGLGTNLTGANRVIIYDPDWNPSTDIQAKERAWRVGQTKDVTIYRLITRGTIEEKVYHRQIHKLFLTDSILRDPQQRRIFKSKDLKDLFVLHEDTEKTETSDLFAELGDEEQSNNKGKKLAGEENTEEDESGLLQSLIQATGIHSAVDHDAILAMNNPERLKVDLEATRVAEKAAEALQQSRLSRIRDGVAVPTWTGNSGSAGLPGFGRKRFGAAVNSRLLLASTSASTSSSARGVLTSGELLAQMKARQAGPATSMKRQTVADELRKFLSDNGGSALSASIVNHFKARVPPSELESFKELLKQVATLKKDNDGGAQGRWFLKHE